ncbi:hypothetical protein [Archangium sp. Cb G35]|uniref:hypothetical protein n=1 Tax=Archangium sp. Cb G35 TaxID=1920190 RepID=UPI0009F814DB|nr:hypothetical protein [Archangium sp. Cb G35]
MSGPHDLFARYTFGHPERAAAELRAVLPAHVVRYGRAGELARMLPDWVALFAQVQAAPEGAEHLVVVIRYLLWVGKDAAVYAAARQVLHSVLDEQRAEELMGTWAEEMLEKGRVRGRQEGREEGREEGLQHGLSVGILRILTARGVPVDEEARQRILTCTDMATLDRWFDRALNATTLSDVLDERAQ